MLTKFEIATVSVAVAIGLVSANFSARHQLSSMSLILDARSNGAQHSIACVRLPDHSCENRQIGAARQLLLTCFKEIARCDGVMHGERDTSLVYGNTTKPTT
jgi:hypothetical protein